MKKTLGQFMNYDFTKTKAPRGYIEIWGIDGYTQYYSENSDGITESNGVTQLMLKLRYLKTLTCKPTTQQEVLDIQEAAKQVGFVWSKSSAFGGKEFTPSEMGVPYGYKEHHNGMLDHVYLTTNTYEYDIDKDPVLSYRFNRSVRGKKLITVKEYCEALVNQLDLETEVRN